MFACLFRRGGLVAAWVLLMLLLVVPASAQRAATSMASSTTLDRGGSTSTARRKRNNNNSNDDLITVDQNGHVTTSSLSDKIDLAFSGVQLEMTTKPKKKKKDSDHKNRLLLDGSIHGQAKPGRMLAVMGPSGAGKVRTLQMAVWKDFSICLDLSVLYPFPSLLFLFLVRLFARLGRSIERFSQTQSRGTPVYQWISRRSRSIVAGRLCRARCQFLSPHDGRRNTPLSRGSQIGIPRFGQ